MEWEKRTHCSPKDFHLPGGVVDADEPQPFQRAELQAEDFQLPEVLDSVPAVLRLARVCHILGLHRAGRVDLVGESGSMPALKRYAAGSDVGVLGLVPRKTEGEDGAKWGVLLRGYARVPSEVRQAPIQFLVLGMRSATRSVSHPCLCAL